MANDKVHHYCQHCDSNIGPPAEILVERRTNKAAPPNNGSVPMVSQIQNKSEEIMDTELKPANKLGSRVSTLVYFVCSCVALS